MINVNEKIFGESPGFFWENGKIKKKKSRLHLSLSIDLTLYFDIQQISLLILPLIAKYDIKLL